jgi:hypothetical protein
MKVLFFTFLILCPYSTSFSASSNSHVIFQTGKGLPLEFDYILESIQKYITSNKEKTLFKQKISKLDQLFSKMTKEEIFFIIKSESYKTILKIKPQFAIKKSYYDQKSLTVFDKFLSSKTISSFSKWVARSIYNDLKNIYSSSEFTTYMYRKKNSSILTKEYILIDKKLNILLPWVGYLLLSRPNEFEEDMKKYMTELFEKISIYANQYLQFSKFEKVEISPLKTKLRFFYIKEYIDPIQTDIGSSVLKIEDINIDPDQFLVDEDAISGWVPKNAPPVIPTPDPNYIKPDKLPVPTNDWIDNL